MLIHAYRIESRPVPLAGMGPRNSKPIDTVQLIGGDEGRSERQREDAAIDYLMQHSPLVDDNAYGFFTWRAKLTNIDAYAERTEDEQLRQTTFLGWRDDKSAKDVALLSPALKSSTVAIYCT